MKKFLTSIFLVAFVFTMLPATTNAQTAYQTYSPRSNEETIAYLHGVIAQLLAQLAARGQTYTYTSVPTVPTYNYNPYTYTGGGQVLGVNYSNRDDDVDVGTGFVRYLNNNDVRLAGTIDLNDASYATVWFEYGEDDDDFGKRTAQRRITRHGQFTDEIDDLKRGRIFYYRAVGESPSGRRDYGISRFLYISGSSNSSNRNNDDEPEANTLRADDVDEDSAELHGEIDMNDFNNGVVFFVYGEDESQIEDVDRDYDSYNDVDEDGDDLQKIRVDSDLDGSEDYWRRVVGLDDNTDHFYQICVEYEDEDNDDVLECGGVEDFETD